MRWGGFGSKVNEKKLTNKFRVLQGGEVLVAKRKGKKTYRQV
jgi:phage gp37-like protein